jgi:nucleotide-binding universal stress UspA family protein
MQSTVFQRIVLPTDGSERETAAIEEAIRLARTIRVEILAIHVLPASDISGAFKGVGTVLQGYEAQMLKVAQAAVDRVEALAKPHGVKVEKAVLRGPAAEKIAESARKGDLLVMPTKGLASPRGARLGSVTARVVEIAQCPVLVYRATP